MAHAELSALIDELKLTITAVFVPWSQSRSKVARPKLSDYSLNWRITLKRDGWDILTTDYSTGIGHAPSYPAGGIARTSSDAAQFVMWEAEHGKRAFPPGLPIHEREPITLDTVSAIWSLVQDANTLNYSTYEEFADALGYDVDSRKGEAIYRASLEIALRLRHGIGETNLIRLQEASQDY